MHKRIANSLTVLLYILSLLILSTKIFANTGVVIYQIQTGVPGAATQELVTMYNNSDTPVDVTGWCVTYGSASDATQTQLGCLTPRKSEDIVRLLLPAQGVVTLASRDYAAAHSDHAFDLIFAGGLAAGSGHVRLLDANKQEIDRVGWGEARNPEATAAVAHPADKVLQRKSLDELYLQDTDDNSMDFIHSIMTELSPIMIYEEVTVLDVCPNLDDIQRALPDGYAHDEMGDCYVDVCANLHGIQSAVPDGYVLSSGFNCDLVRPEYGKLIITELLPNPSSYDSGKEFIELYNPEPVPISLLGYVLQIGPGFAKSYPLPPHVIIGPGAYLAFSDLDLKLTLPNSSASVRLLDPSGEIIYVTETYLSPKDDIAWALIDGVWQYTNQPTPGSSNIAYLELTQSNSASQLAPCAVGQYRNPETNRCRLIQTTTSTLTPCKEGQVRNPETNRCRSVLAAISSLVPCKDNQERNPDTGRCRAVSSSSTLTPCKEGEERNPATNRCRKIVSNASASGLTTVRDVEVNSKGRAIQWWLVVTVLAAVLGYSLYEWRRDIANIWYRRRVRTSVVRRAGK